MTGPAAHRPRLLPIVASRAVRKGRTRGRSFRRSFAERGLAEISVDQAYPVVRSCAPFRSIVASCDDASARAGLAAEGGCVTTFSAKHADKATECATLTALQALPPAFFAGGYGKLPHGRRQ